MRAARPGRCLAAHLSPRPSLPRRDTLEDEERMRERCRQGSSCHCMLSSSRASLGHAHGLRRQPRVGPCPTRLSAPPPQPQPLPHSFTRAVAVLRSGRADAIVSDANWVEFYAGIMVSCWPAGDGSRRCGDDGAPVQPSITAPSVAPAATCWQQCERSALTMPSAHLQHTRSAT